MKKLLIVGAIALALAGCITPQKRAEINAMLLDLKAQRDAGKITWTQWANEGNDYLRSQGRLNPQEQKLLAYRVLIASRVDARQMSPAEGDYAIASAVSDLSVAEKAQQAADAAAWAGVAGAGAAMMQAGQPAPRSTISCTTWGNTTNCY
jgi:hypothetical protein